MKLLLIFLKIQICSCDIKGFYTSKKFISFSMHLENDKNHFILPFGLIYASMAKHFTIQNYKTLNRRIQQNIVIFFQTKSRNVTVNA